MFFCRVVDASSSPNRRCPQRQAKPSWVSCAMESDEDEEANGAWPAPVKPKTLNEDPYNATRHMKSDVVVDIPGLNILV